MSPVPDADAVLLDPRREPRADARSAYRPPVGVTANGAGGARGPVPSGAASGDALERLLLEQGAILDVTPSAIRVFDAEGALTRLNAAAQAEHPDGDPPRTLRALWERDQPLRAAPAGRGSDVRVALADHPASRAMRGESVRSETYVVRRGREGERRVVETYAGPVRDADGHIVGAVLVDRDATERARLARALEEQVRRTMELNERVMNEAATLERMVEARSRELLALQESRSRERRLAAVGQLAAGVMHDVNNALNPIMAAAFLLKRRAEDPTAVRDYADRIAKAAETCAASAARVGRFIRQEPPAEGRDEIVDLTLMADEVLAMASAAWGEGLHGVQVAITRDLAPGVSARGIPGEIREALLNLVKNSVDAMPTGGRLTIASGITGVADGEEREAWIAVRDTGTGMTEDVRDRAFEPFFSTKGAGGSGLGLAEVYGIMKRHRGRAEIESAPGAGTTVRLVFPFAEPGAAVPAATTERAGARRRVLVVEDNTEGREFLRALLATDGHLVDAVEKVAEARALLDVPRRATAGAPDGAPDGAPNATADGASAGGAADAESAPYEVLITDIGLPDGNGWDLVQEARARWPGLRIAVVTGWEPQMRESALADLTLRKPLRAQQLLDFVGHDPAAAPPADAPLAALSASRVTTSMTAAVVAGWFAEVLATLPPAPFLP